MGCQLATLRVADGQGLTRVMGDWDWRCFKSLYGCSSSLPVRERQFLPTKRQISLCTCLLMRVFVTVLFPFSACLSRTHCLFNFSFSKLTVWFLSNVREVHPLLHGLQRRARPHHALPENADSSQKFHRKQGAETGTDLLWATTLEVLAQLTCAITGGLFGRCSLTCCIHYNVAIFVVTWCITIFVGKNSKTKEFQKDDDWLMTLCL